MFFFFFFERQSQKRVGWRGEESKAEQASSVLTCPRQCSCARSELQPDFPQDIQDASTWNQPPCCPGSTLTGCWSQKPEPGTDPRMQASFNITDTVVPKNQCDWGRCSDQEREHKSRDGLAGCRIYMLRPRLVCVTLIPLSISGLTCYASNVWIVVHRSKGFCEPLYKGIQDVHTMHRRLSIGFLPQTGSLNVMHDQRCF